MATATEAQTYKSPDQMFREAQVHHAIEEFEKINGARRSAKAMKVIGTIGLFGLAAVSAAAALAFPFVGVPTAAAVMALAEASGALAGISAVLAGVGIGREAFNKRQIRKVAKTYGLDKSRFAKAA